MNNTTISIFLVFFQLQRKTLNCPVGLSRSVVSLIFGGRPDQFQILTWVHVHFLAAIIRR